MENQIARSVMQTYFMSDLIVVILFMVLELRSVGSCQLPMLVRIAVSYSDNVRDVHPFLDEESQIPIAYKSVAVFSDEARST